MSLAEKDRSARGLVERLDGPFGRAPRRAFASGMRPRLQRHRWRPRRTLGRRGRLDVRGRRRRLGGRNAFGPDRTGRRIAERRSVVRCGGRGSRCSVTRSLYRRWPVRAPGPLLRRQRGLLRRVSGRWELRRRQSALLQSEHAFVRGMRVRCELRGPRRNDLLRHPVGDLRRLPRAGELRRWRQDVRGGHVLGPAGRLKPNERARP